jgi:hypothetical protein
MSRTVTAQESARIARDLLAEQLKGQIIGIVTPRCQQLATIVDTLENNGYPTDALHLAHLSLWPYVFQEAIYDDIDWHSRNPADLRHLRPLLELDFLVQMAGRRWADASRDEAEAYDKRCRHAINWRKKELAWRDEQRELAGKLGDAFFVGPDDTK